MFRFHCSIWEDLKNEWDAECDLQQAMEFNVDNGGQSILCDEVSNQEELSLLSSPAMSHGTPILLVPASREEAAEECLLMSTCKDALAANKADAQRAKEFVKTIQRELFVSTSHSSVEKSQDLIADRGVRRRKIVSQSCAAKTSMAAVIATQKKVGTTCTSNSIIVPTAATVKNNSPKNPFSPAIILRPNILSEIAEDEALGPMGELPLKKVNEVKQVMKKISQHPYNMGPRKFYNIDKYRPLIALCEEGRKISEDLLPIQCIEAVFLAIYLTQSKSFLTRFAIRFDSVIRSSQDGWRELPFDSELTRTYAHLVLGFEIDGKFGAFGTSRNVKLAHKLPRFTSLLDMIKHYEEAYDEEGHELVSVSVSNVIPYSVDVFKNAPGSPLVFAQRKKSKSNGSNEALSAPSVVLTSSPLGMYICKQDTLINWRLKSVQWKFGTSAYPSIDIEEFIAQRMHRRDHEVKQLQDFYLAKSAEIRSYSAKR